MAIECGDRIKYATDEIIIAAKSERGRFPFYAARGFEPNTCIPEEGKTN